MGIILTSSENSKTFKPHILILNLINKNNQKHEAFD